MRGCGCVRVWFVSVWVCKGAVCVCECVGV